MSLTFATGLAAFLLAVGGNIAPAISAEQSGAAANEHQPPADEAQKAAQQSLAGRPIVSHENADYQKALKECKKLPLSERNACKSRAGNSTKLENQARRETNTAH